MPDVRSQPRRGTTVLQSDETPGVGGRPWWRGAAIAGGGFVGLLVLAVLLHALPSPDPDDSVQRTAVVPVEDGAGGETPPAAREPDEGPPAGYPRTESGATRAAVNYQLARSSVLYIVDRSARSRVLTGMATSDALATLKRNDDAAMDLALVSLGVGKRAADTLVARAAPMGVRLTGFSDREATVQVWMAGVIGTTGKSAPLPVSASWNTYTLTLQWQQDDWKLAAVSSEPGPTPLASGGGTPSTVDDFRRADKEFDAPPYLR
ncbi:hypothetical protein ACWGIB_23670 [Streptomyces xiamenensis]